MHARSSAPAPHQASPGAALPSRLRPGRAGDAAEAQADRLAAGHGGIGETVQAGTAAPGRVPQGVSSVLAEPGRGLAAAERGPMEQRFGCDFSSVRLHADGRAGESAAALGARAYTAGQHIVWGRGAPSATSAEGRQLLAHELAHVVQQRAGPVLLQADPAPADPKVTALKADLVKTFGLGSVTDSKDAAWTPAELEKMKRALARVPAADLAAIKGVELRRVVSTTEFGAAADGMFKQQADAATAQRLDRIEMANSAFALDVDYDADPTTAKATYAGTPMAGAPSEAVALHEVGHAVESASFRSAEALRLQADQAQAGALASLQQATKNYNAAALSSMTTPGWSNPKEKAYSEALGHAQTKLGGIDAAMNAVPESPTAAESQAGADAIKKAMSDARAAIAKRALAAKALAPGSAVIRQDIEQAHDAWLAAAEPVRAALAARAEAQVGSEKAQSAEDVTMTTVTPSSGTQLKLTRRLAELVAVIEAHQVDVPAMGLGTHVDDNWPDNPAEAYAEMYSLSLTSPQGLAKANAEVAAFFKSPVGPKGAQQAKVKAWLKAHP